MGRNLLRHAYNYFDTHEAQHHDTIFNHCIDILPYRYASQIPTLCLCPLGCIQLTYIKGIDMLNKNTPGVKKRGQVGNTS